MADPEKIQETNERPSSDEKKSDFLKANELKSAHEDASKVAADRSSFLRNSLGKALSPSTEYLKDMVVEISDASSSGLSAVGDAASKMIENKPAGLDLSQAARNDLSILHPIDSIKELVRKIGGESEQKPADSSDSQPGDKSPEKPTVSEKPEELLAKFKDDSQCKEQREKLLKQAEEKIKDKDELKKFKEDVESFEKRGSEQQSPLKPEDIANTYKEIGKLMEKPDAADVPVKMEDRVKLAEQVMRQAAHPTDISQGCYSTCNTTTVEVRTYTKNPAEAARLVADVATTGKYTSNGTPPVTVEIDRDSLMRHGQSKDDIPADGKRTYASQLFEVTATNVYHKARHDKGMEDIRYEQHEPKPAGPNNRPPADNGERLYNYSDKDPRTGKPNEVMDHNVPTRSPGMTNDAIAEINRQINKEARDGNQEGPVLLTRENDKNTDKVLNLKAQLLAIDLKQGGIGDGTPPDLSNPQEIKKIQETIADKEKNGLLSHEKAENLRNGLDTLVKEKNHEHRNDNGVVYIHSPAEMEETLAKMKEEGRLPAIIAVSGSQEPFRSDSGAHQTGDLAGGHVVTVTDYHPAADGKPATVDVDNQWNKSADRTMTVEELYKAQEAPKGPVMEKLDALEKKYAAKEIQDAEYYKELQKLYVEQIKRWEADPSGEAANVEILRDTLRGIQPPSRGKKIMEDAIAEYKAEKVKRH